MLRQKYPLPLPSYKPMEAPKAPRQRMQQRQPIRPIAFGIALIGAPLVVTTLTFWIFFNPVYALILGAIPYLTLGTPALLFYIPRHGHRPIHIAGLAAGVASGLLCACLPLAAIFGDRDSLALVAFFGGCSLIFAPIWGGTFGWLYSAMVSKPTA